MHLAIVDMGKEVGVLFHSLKRLVSLMSTSKYKKTAKKWLYHSHEWTLPQEAKTIIDVLPFDFRLAFRIRKIVLGKEAPLNETWLQYLTSLRIMQGTFFPSFATRQFVVEKHVQRGFVSLCT